MDDESHFEPAPLWPSFSAEAEQVAVAQYAVVRGGLDEQDFIAYLVEVSGGEIQAMRTMASVLVLQARVARFRNQTEVAVYGLDSWEKRRCPTCGNYCQDCLGDWECETRQALGETG
jgi:hypothetical protein